MFSFAVAFSRNNLAATVQNKNNQPSEVERKMSQTGLMVGLSIEEQTVNIRLVGKLIARNAAHFKLFVKTLIEQGYSSCLFDLANLTELDGAGVAALVWANNQMHQIGGCANVTLPNPALYHKLLSLNFQYLVNIETVTLDAFAQN